MDKKKFSCYVVGDDNITMQCAEILLSTNHKLLGLISSSENIKKWCDTNSIPYIKSVKEFEKNIKHDFDILFSIVNSQILSKKILSIPRQYAINYHNSPLPKYAGLYATSWAILNSETQHAITWHIMNEQIDAGDILKQQFFPIKKNDTALSLNLKCYEQAIQSFYSLIEEIDLGLVTPIKQNLLCRSYYTLWNKITNLGFISWNQSSENIDRLCRSLSLGHYRNELAIPKFIIKGELFYLKTYKILNVSSKMEPGSIVSFSNKSLHIATKTFDIAIFELTDLKGKSCPISKLILNLGLNTSTRLEKIEKGYIEKLSHYIPGKNPNIEKFWVKEYLNTSSSNVAFLSKLIRLENGNVLSPNINKVPNRVLEKISKIFKNHSSNSVIVTSILIYLFRLNNYRNLSAEFSPLELQNELSEIQNFFSPYLPLTTKFNSRLSFIEALSFISAEYTRLTEKGSYAKDIFIRYPELKIFANTIDISIIFVNAKESPVLKNNKKLNIYLSEDGSWFYIHINTNYKSILKSFNYLKNMHGHILTLLNDIMENPNKKIFELRIIGTKEQNYLIKTWNNTNCIYNEKKLLHQYFEQQAHQNPERTAVAYQEQTINYKELNEQANRLAYYLRDLRLRPDNIVGISLNRSIEMIVCILGILKAGAAYLPLDPNYPKERINHMLEDSKAQLLLVDKESMKQKWETYQGKIIEISSILSLDHIPTNNLKPNNKARNLAYVIYTSGTTGKPKGVAIPHRSACNHMLWMEKKYHFKEKDIFLQKTPFSFDPSIWEIFIPLQVGAKLIIAPNYAHTCPNHLMQLVYENKVSVLQLVPTMFKELISNIKFSSACKSLKHIFCGGETLTPESICAFFNQRLLKTKLHNLYGPTETTIDAISSTCNLNDVENHFSRIGKPIMNTKLFVLDDEKQLMPIGIEGELYISGDGLARGYLNNLKETALKFIPNPFSNKVHDRLYKTGDLVKWQSNGHIEFHGRIDNQIKVRGFRIELGEIEAHLKKIPFIYQCIVKQESLIKDTDSLAAYLVLKDRADISALDIRNALKQFIPDYMIPNQFYVVSRLLHAPNGKLDRTNIPTPLRPLPSGHEYINASTDIEKKLKNIWSSVLKIENLGIFDDFFELGGNSLSAMQIISIISCQFSITLNIRKLFDFPTINALAKEIETTTLQNSRHHNFYENIIVPIKKSGEEIPLFLVHPVGGSIFWYKALGNYLDENRPLYAIQDPGIDENKFIFDNLEEMASAYIQAIQSIQPKGPYLLGGASFGATVAVEMAKQLEENGEKIIAIISLDGWAFYPILQENEKYFKSWMTEQNSRILKKYIKNNLNNSEFLLKLQWSREKMLMKYQMPFIKARFILFKASELIEMFQYDASFNWWEKFTAEKIELHIVPGDHETMFYEPFVKILAKKINDSIVEIVFNDDNLDRSFYEFAASSQNNI